MWFTSIRDERVVEVCTVESDPKPPEFTALIIEVIPPYELSKEEELFKLLRVVVEVDPPLSKEEELLLLRVFVEVGQLNHHLVLYNLDRHYIF